MLRVLTYHRVADPRHTPLLHPGLISATPAAFAQQMGYVARHYRVVSMAEVLQAVVKGTALPRRAVLLTFDDAYYDFGDIAWPILHRYRLPVTLFVPTGYPNRPERAFWWDRLYHAMTYTSHTALRNTPLGVLSLTTPEQRHTSLRSLQNYLKTIPHAEAMAMVDTVCTTLATEPFCQKSVLTWEELRQLAREGVTLGAHTQTHPIMTQLLPQQIQQEIIGSQQDLHQEIGQTLPIFCYPSGRHDDAVVRVLKDEGFVLAFTTLHGQNDLRTVDLLRLRRTNITRRASLPIFRLHLLRLGAYLDMWRHRKQSGG
jgi:peptidoglycan/xylan/chitin deacetylase (PgdA/CDA1 family)